MNNNNTHSAFITGAARGIGLASAMALANKGFAVALNDIEDSDHLDRVCKKISALGVVATKITGDVADLKAHEAMLEAAEKYIGPLSTLVNNAGVSVLERGDILDVSQASFDRCIAVNTRAQFFLSQSWAKRQIKRRIKHKHSDDRFYSIINVTSSNAIAASENRSEYCVSKADAAMSSKVFAVCLAREGIAVYDVQPGIIETSMTKNAIKEYRARIESGLTLVKRAGQAEDVARVIANLASNELPYTTGQTISVDGGMLLARF